MSNLILPTAEGIERAHDSFPEDLIRQTPLAYNRRLSREFDANIFLKLETDQDVGSYKIRGSFWKLFNLPRNTPVVCVSAGNHSQGFSASCNYLGMNGVVFMPKTADPQKQQATQEFGNGNVKVITAGETFAEAKEAMLKYAEQTGAVIIHPFDDAQVCEGQGTVMKEILAQMYEEHREAPDFVSVPIGGGGLYAGARTYTERVPFLTLLGVEPDTSAAMNESLHARERLAIQVSNYIDGVAVPQVGMVPWHIAQRDNSTHFLTVPENSVTGQVDRFYRKEGRVVETAGALSVAGLEAVRDKIRGMCVVAILSGRNIAMEKLEEVKERAAIFSGHKKVLTVTLADAPGAFREVINEFPADDAVNIDYIHYDNRTNRGSEKAPVDIDLSSANTEELADLVQRIGRNHSVVDHKTPRKRRAL